MGKRRDNKGDSEKARESRYDEALLSANWNPVIDLLGASSAKTLDEASRDPSRDVAEEDPDAFLRRFYQLGN